MGQGTPDPPSSPPATQAQVLGTGSPSIPTASFRLSPLPVLSTLLSGPCRLRRQKSASPTSVSKAGGC